MAMANKRDGASGDGGPGIREQAQASLKQVQAIVEAAGSSVAKIDKCTVFLTRQEDFQAMNFSGLYRP